MKKQEKKSIRIELYEKDKKKLAARAKLKNIPLKNMLENHCVELIEKS